MMNVYAKWEKKEWNSRKNRAEKKIYVNEKFTWKHSSAHVLYMYEGKPMKIDLLLYNSTYNT